MHLLRDLYMIYGDLLVRANKTITPEVVKRVIAAGDKHKQVRVPLVNTDIYADFEKVFDDDRYRIIFKPLMSAEEIARIAGSLMMENDLILELSIMKRNLPYTYYHVMVVAALTIKLFLAFKIRTLSRDMASHCGFTHDIGKTRIPVEILNKPGRLTEGERAMMETHPISGYLLLNYYLKKDRRDCSLASLEHHRKLDGSGYPKGVQKIHQYTRLITPVDIMDALMTKRPYRKNAFSLRAALDYLLKEADANRLEKKVVLMLISFARSAKPDIRSIRISREIRERLPEELTHDKYR